MITLTPRSASALHTAGRSGVEELSFVDAHDLGVWRDLIEQLPRVVDDRRLHPHLTMRHDVVGRITRVDARLEDLDALPRDSGAAQPANELFALAAEHAADDDFDPALIGLAHDVHW